MAQEAKQLKHTHISGEKKWFELNLKEVWEYRDLIWLFTKKSFVVSYKQTILGPVWIFLRPLMTSIIYTFVFGGIAGMSTDGLPQILFYMSGNAMWNYFASNLSGNANTFTANAGLFGKVYFPRLTTPISHVLSNVVQFGIQMILTTAILIFYIIKGEVHPNYWAMLLIPVILVHLGIMGMGIGIVFSSMTTKYRDLTILIGFGVSLLMYLTPVIYPLSTIGDGWLKWIIMLNPVTAPMEVFRYALLGAGQIMPLYLAISWVFTIAIMIFGIMVFNRVEKTFMDTV